MPAKKDLIILDLDGTLVDSKSDLCRSVNYVRREFGLGPLNDRAIGDLIGNGVARMIEGALEGRSPVDIESGVAMFLEYYREHMLDSSDLYPGVRETLERLSASSLAVLTNKPYKFSRLMLRRLGVLEYFQAVYGGNSFDRKKPDPIGIIRILSDVGAKPEATWMVGDSSIDVQTGRAAGVKTCGVTYGYAAHTFEADPPDRVIDTFPQLLDIVSSDDGAVFR